MFRTDLPPTRGMLFDFGQTRMVTMWMKNTPLSLDMVFIRADGTVARVAERTTPLSEDIVSSGEEVAFALRAQRRRRAPHRAEARRPGSSTPLWPSKQTSRLIATFRMTSKRLNGEIARAGRCRSVSDGGSGSQFTGLAYQEKNHAAQVTGQASAKLRRYSWQEVKTRVGVHSHTFQEACAKKRMV